MGDRPIEILTLPTLPCKYGAHVSTEEHKTLYDLVKHANEVMGFKTIQFFFGGRLSHKRRRTSAEEVQKAREYVLRNNMTIYTHFPYAASLVSVGEYFIPDLDEQSEDYNKFCNWKKAILYETEVVGSLNAPGKGGVVIHPGSVNKVVQRMIKNGEIKKNDTDAIQALLEKGLETIASTLNGIQFSENAFLILENTAGESEGRKIPSKVEEIGYILKHLSEKTTPHIKVCIDTAHTYGSGEYDFSLKEDVDRFTADLDKHSVKVDLIHLNDSNATFFSKKDVHNVVGRGLQWCCNPGRMVGYGGAYVPLLDHKPRPYDYIDTGYINPTLYYFIKECAIRSINILFETSPWDACPTAVKYIPGYVYLHKIMEKSSKLI